ncbi:MAG: LysR family transcriptional regulator [Verrucomicrobiales bacterium]|nr:LysR family transcriptional regulator [Verrucomicrobiales bacterium]
MELYQLEYFLEAARQRNFTRAAASLNLAQAALSEQIRKLEAELGTQLFNRGRRETVLTAAGETLRVHAEGLLRGAAAARLAVADLVELRSGRLTIGAIPSVSACLLPAAITAFRKRYPAVELALFEGTSESIAQWVESGRVEFGIVQLPATNGSFDEIPLLREPFVALVAKAHPLAKQSRISLAKLAQEPFVLYKGRARDTALAACREAGFEPRIACESSELETIRSLVAAGLGVAVLPQLATRQPSKDCQVLRLRGDPVERQVALLSRAGHAPSPSAAAFRTILAGQH